MDTPNEHQRRWVEQKVPTAADLETIKLVKTNFQASVNTAAQLFAELSRRLAASETFVDFYDNIDRFAEITRTLARFAQSHLALVSKT